jgi:hypothetical protein
MRQRRQPEARLGPPSGAVQIGRRGGGDRREAALRVDGREVEVGEGVLAVLEVMADAQQIENCEQREENEKRPGAGQDDQDAAAQRLTGCGWRRERVPRASRRRP